MTETETIQLLKNLITEYESLTISLRDEIKYLRGQLFAALDKLEQADHGGGGDDDQRTILR